MDEELKNLLQENLRLTKETHDLVRGIKGHLFWGRAWGFTKLFLKLAVLGFLVYLGFKFIPPFLKDSQQFIAPYQALIQSFMGGSPKGDAPQLPVDLKKLLPQVSPEMQKALSSASPSEIQKIIGSLPPDILKLIPPQFLKGAGGAKK